MRECDRCGQPAHETADGWVHASLRGHRAAVDDATYALCEACGRRVAAYCAGERGGVVAAADQTTWERASAAAADLLQLRLSSREFDDGA